MKRVLDILLAISAGVCCAIPVVVIALAIKLTSPGPVLYWSQRVGRYNRLFWMPKFRTMRTDTPQLATHLLQNADAWMSPIGRFLRSSSLDELPQVYSILTGDMSVVGPRPALFNQDDLIAARTAAGVHEIPPGLTGWAQINGRDELSIPDKVALDRHYLQTQSLRLDLWILCATLFKVVRQDGVAQAGEEQRLPETQKRRAA